MKKSKFTEQQIVFALKQAEAGVGIDELCRKYGISAATWTLARLRATHSGAISGRPA